MTENIIYVKDKNLMLSVDVQPSIIDEVEKQKNAAAKSALEAEQNAELARDWAIKKEDTVDGTEYSAKYYSEVAANKASDVVANLNTFLSEREDILNEISSIKESFAQDLANYVQTTELPEKVAKLITDNGCLKEIPEEYITETELSAKGYLTAVPEEYVTETKLSAKEYLTAVPEEYVTETKLSAKGYLTAVPEEYVTETELSEKGYMTTIPDTYALKSEVPTDNHINELINTALGSIENGSY